MPRAYLSTVGHIQKISDLLKQLDRQTAEEGLSLRGILSGMREGVLIANSDRKITLVNEALQKFFPAEKSPVGRGVLEVFRRHELDRAVAKSLETGQDQSIEMGFDFPQPSGPARRQQFEIHIGPMALDSGNFPQAAVVVFQDITGIRVLEATRREFVANVSHEFRTPLTVINGYVETLLDGVAEDPEMTTHALRSIHRNVQRLSLLLEDLLTISSMETRDRLLNFTRVNLRELVERVVENLKTAPALRGMEVLIDWPEETAFAEADPQRIEQVYWNLLSNALRHGEADPLVIRITARPLGDATIEITFADNGTGIPHADQAHIFERFYRVQKHRSRDGGGTGLGLSIVKNIILAHGGSVSLTSSPGQGASFAIRLPLTQNEISPAK
jgi:two-component system phosphate regulon sensor histidine kinase PhoR